jgi:hypothetical protein
MPTKPPVHPDSGENVALVDVALEAADDRFARLRRAGQVVQESDAAHQQRAVRPIERDHQVMAFVGDGGS